MVPDAKNVLKYWLQATEALAAESRAEGEQSVIVGNIPAKSTTIIQMSGDGAFNAGRVDPGATQPGAAKITGLRDTSWRPAVIQVQAIPMQADRQVGRPEPVLAVPCEVMVTRGIPAFRPPRNSLIPSIPRYVLASDGEDKDGIVMGKAEVADEWLRVNGAAIETVRTSGSWVGWWNCAVSLLAQVTNQTVEDPIAQLANEINATMQFNGDRYIEVTINVVDTGTVPGAALNITNTMRALIESDFLTDDGLTTKMLSGRSAKSDLKLASMIREAASNVGMMDRYGQDGAREARPLDPSQRTAVLRHLSGATLSTVKGPPGTGKTSTMRAIVGDALVRPLLGQEDEPRPKMILATGATNQAVVNIIGSFASATSPASPASARPLSARWVDRVPSFGWFAPSRAIQNRMKKDPTNTAPPSVHDGFQGFGRWCQNPEAEGGLKFRTTFYGTGAELSEMYSGMGLTSRLYGAVNLYLESAASNISTDFVRVSRDGEAHPALKRVTKRLRALVKEQARNQFEVQDSLWKMLSTGDRGSVAAALGHALETALLSCGEFSSTPEEARETATSIIRLAFQIPEAGSADADLAALELFHKVQSVLDTGPRLSAFHYASRYWEGRWLGTRIDRLQDQREWPIELAKIATTQGMTAAIRRDMEEILFLAPCIVATAHTLPSIFGIFGRPETAFGIADEMIVDEAGQAPQDLIVPVTAFAKRAIVLGDTEQIEPVRSLTPERDHALLRSFVIAEGLSEASIPLACRISTGSAMALAIDASDLTDLTLRYHYRCRPEIIRWSSEHCYNNTLIAVRPSYQQKEADEAVPTLGFVRVQGRTERTPQGSIGNPTEAAAIADWLFNNKAEIEARFGIPIHECVGVITPYALQKRIIGGLLRQRFKDDKEVLLQKMTIGSVHQLQGAERPLVLFSTAVTMVNVDPTSRAMSFFDRSYNLLNVARSRAAESFILFAAPSMIDRTDDLPFGRFATDIRDRGRRLFTIRRAPEVQKPRPGADADALSMSPG